MHWPICKYLSLVRDFQIFQVYICIVLIVMWLYWYARVIFFFYNCGMWRVFQTAGLNLGWTMWGHVHRTLASYAAAKHSARAAFKAAAGAPPFRNENDVQLETHTNKTWYHTISLARSLASPRLSVLPMQDFVMQKSGAQTRKARTEQAQRQIWPDMLDMLDVKQRFEEHAL